ncbi:MAG: hypothetical protein ACO26U_13880 [Burkholderiaceae bacterium]
MKADSLTRPLRRAPDAFTLCALLMCAGPTAAQPVSEPALAESVVRYETSMSLEQHGNLYRVPDQANPRAGTRLRVAAGVSFEREWSLQRMEASARVSPTWRVDGAGDDALDWATQARWDWAAGRALFGDLGATLTRLQTPWEDLGSTRINHQRIGSGRFLAGLRLTQDWSLIAATDVWRSDNTLAERRPADLRRNAWETGVRFWPDRALQVDAVWRKETGRPQADQVLDAAGQPLPQPVSNDWDQHAGLLRARWNPAERSQWLAQIGHLRRQHEQLPQRDFSGVTGLLQGRWAMTGAVDWQVSLARTIDVPELLSASYVDVRAFELRPRWQVSGLTALSLWLALSRREYSGDPAVAVGAAEERRDRWREGGLRLEVALHRRVLAHIDVRRTQRSSNIAAFEFDDNTVSAGLTARF